MESEQWLEDKFRCLLAHKWDQYLYGMSFQCNILIKESRCLQRELSGGESLFHKRFIRDFCGCVDDWFAAK